MSLELDPQTDLPQHQLDVMLEDAWQQRELSPHDSVANWQKLSVLPNLGITQKAKADVIESFHHGREFRFKDAADSAMDALERLRNPADYLWLARCHGRLAVGLHSLGDLATAYLEFQKQVKIAKVGKSSLFREELFLGYHNLGRHFFRINDLSWADHYFKKCYSLVDSSDLQMGFLLLNHAQSHFIQGRHKAAFKKALKAMEIGQCLKVDRILVYTLPVLANLAIKNDNAAKAEEYLLEGCEIATRASLPPIQVQLLLMEHYSDTRQYKQATKLLDNIENPKDVIDLAKLYSLKSHIFESTGALKEALAYHKQYFNLQEQIFSLKKEDQAHASSVVKRIKRLERQYEDACQKNARLTDSIRHMSQAHNQMKALAERDPLTNLYNRRQFMILANASLRLASESNSSVSFAIIDVDRFKNINDNFGHQVGDEVLKILASLSSDILRGHDAIGRFGGEEFVVLMPNTELDASITAMQRFRQSFMDYNWGALATGLQVTFSCGIAESHGDMTFSDLLSIADKCLYLAKDQGRNQVIGFSENVEA